MGYGIVNAYYTLFRTKGYGEIISNLLVYDDINFTGDVSIPSGKSLLLKDNVSANITNGYKIEVNGYLYVYNGSKFTKASGGTYWSGINLNYGGEMIVNGDVTIEYAYSGIDFGGGTLSNGNNTVTINNCSLVGICADFCSPTIRKVKCQNCGSGWGGFIVYGSGVNVILRRNTVESSIHGFCVESSANAAVDSCDITKSNTGHSIQLATNGLADLYGLNNISPKAGTKAINNQDSDSIQAQSNWWGRTTPADSLFTYPARVSWAPFFSDSLTTAGVYKGVQIFEKPQRKIALDMELNGDFSGAYAIYSDLLGKETEPSWRKFYITSMLRVCDKSTKNYNDLRSKITQELPTAKGIYKGSLDFILCDILLREGKYNEAVNAFKEKAANYQNDQTAVEMYTRISEIYSNYLNDKTSGLKYADMAKAINPGSPALRLAYEFAGSSYDPSKFTDVFGTGAQKQEPETKTVATSDYIETYPNPANPATTISYSLSSPSKVNLTVYNITGQKVVTLVDGPVSSGVHTVKFDGSRFGSGLYFYKFASDKFTKTGKMMILK